MRLYLVYIASNNKLARTDTLVKSAIIQINATPFREWYELHYAQSVSKKLAAKFAARSLLPEGEDGADGEIAPRSTRLQGKKSGRED